jgi:cytochrome b
LYNFTSLAQDGTVFKEGVAVKGMWTFLQTCVVFLGTVAVVLAEEAATAEAGGDPYQAIYYVWYALIAIILAWGVYDSFFRPID